MLFKIMNHVSRDTKDDDGALMYIEKFDGRAGKLGIEAVSGRKRGKKLGDISVPWYLGGGEWLSGCAPEA